MICYFNQTVIFHSADCGKSEYPNAGEGQDWGNPPLKRIRSDNSVFIVGGEQARPREFPWQVMMIYDRGSERVLIDH